MKTLEQLIDIYCEGWSAPTPADRERLIRTVLTSDATYCDPRTSGELAIPELLEHIAAVHAGRPGARVIRTSKVDAHHGFARFHWCVEMPDGSRLPEGIDIVTVTVDGQKLTKILGFFGPLQ
jgi:hypothetical protein